MKPALLFSSILLLSCHGVTKAPVPAKDTAMVASASSPLLAKSSSLANRGTSQKNTNDYMMPGKEHQLMASWNGTWLGEGTIWHDPAAPIKANFTTINKMILGGRYQQSSQKANFNGIAFEGQSTLGYDNTKKTFVSTWVDNMGTGIIMMEGLWNETTKSLTLRGLESDPATGAERGLRETIRIIDDNRQVVEIFEGNNEEKEKKTMEIIYTKKK